MKILGRTQSLSQYPILECLEVIKRLGFDGVEICLEHPDLAPETLTSTLARQVAAKVQEIDLSPHSVSYHKNYIYDDKLKNEYLLLKKRYPDSKFIIFITPVIMDGLNKYKKLDLNKDYFLWLNDLIEVFGEVYTFMYPNSVTADIYNFFDPSHFFPDIGHKIALSIISNGNINYDFGIKLNKDNLEWFITKYNNNEFQKSIKEL